MYVAGFLTLMNETSRSSCPGGGLAPVGFKVMYFRGILPRISN